MNGAASAVLERVKDVLWPRTCAQVEGECAAQGEDEDEGEGGGARNENRSPFAAIPGGYASGKSLYRVMKRMNG